MIILLADFVGHCSNWQSVVSCPLGVVLLPPVPAEVYLLPAEVQFFPAEVQFLLAEAQFLPAEVQWPVGEAVHQS